MDARPSFRKGMTAPTTRKPLTVDEKKHIKALLKQAGKLMKAGDGMGALESWVKVLHRQVDQTEALQGAVRFLLGEQEYEYARELTWRAIRAGTTDPAVYMTAIDIAHLSGAYAEFYALVAHITRLPGNHETLLMDAVDRFFKDMQTQQTLDMLTRALEKYPNNQALLLRLGQLHENMRQIDTARRYYDQAARVRSGTQASRLADRRLRNYTPVLTDRERGSWALALREAAGVALVYLVLAWTDARLDLLQVGGERLGGVGLALLGGYLLVTATSSPQQVLIVRLLGGAAPKRSPAEGQAPTELPILPDVVRALFGVLGLALLLLAFILVFQRSILLLPNPIPPPVPEWSR